MRVRAALYSGERLWRLLVIKNLALLWSGGSTEAWANCSWSVRVGMDSIVSVIAGPSRQAQLGVSARSVTPLFGQSPVLRVLAAVRPRTLSGHGSGGLVRCGGAADVQLGGNGVNAGREVRHIESFDQVLAGLHADGEVPVVDAGE